MIVDGVVVLVLMLVCAAFSLLQGSLLQCVMTPGDKWMPKSTDDIAAACLEQVSHGERSCAGLVTTPSTAFPGRFTEPFVLFEFGNLLE